MSVKRAFPLILLLASFLSARAADSDSLARNPAFNAIQPRFQPLATLLTRTPSEAPYYGRNFSVFHNGQERADRYMEDLRNARSTIHITTYHINGGQYGTAVRDLLTQKASEGVDVKFIYENQSNIVPSGFFTPLREAGADVAYFTPLNRPWRFLRHMNHRNHQKITVIDNTIGYSGGMNLTDKYLSRWTDTDFRVEGAAAAALEGPFQDIWKDLRPDFTPSVSIPEESSGDIILQTVGDRALDYEHHLENALVWILDNTQERFYAITPYFAPTIALMDALKRAVAAGKDVRIILPAQPDNSLMGACHLLYYRRCIEAGIRLYACPGNFNHSKIFVADDYLSSIGSTNLDARSLIRNYENSTFIYDTETAGELGAYFQEILETSKEIDPKTLPKLHLSEKLFVVFAWLISAHL